MTNAKIRSIVSRALAFTSTLMLSLTLVSFLPSVKERRQRSFAQAAMDGNLYRMRWLHLGGASVNVRENCCMPLYLAAGAGKLDVVRYLLGEGADVNAREKFGGTALMEAAYAGHIDVIQELLFRGAEINAIGNDGTALDVAIGRNNAAAVDLLKHYGGRRAGEIQ